MELRVQTRLTDFAPFLRFHLLPRHACARLQPSHAVLSIKLSKKKKRRGPFFFFVFSPGASASHAIAVFWSRAKPADDTSHFLPPFPSFCFVCARGRDTLCEVCCSKKPDMARAVGRGAEIQLEGLENRGKRRGRVWPFVSVIRSKHCMQRKPKVSLIYVLEIQRCRDWKCVFPSFGNSTFSPIGLGMMWS